MQEKYKVGDWIVMEDFLIVQINEISPRQKEFRYNNYYITKINNIQRHATPEDFKILNYKKELV